MNIILSAPYLLSPYVLTLHVVSSRLYVCEIFSESDKGFRKFRADTILVLF